MEKAKEKAKKQSMCLSFLAVPLLTSRFAGPDKLSSKEKISQVFTLETWLPSKQAWMRSTIVKFTNKTNGGSSELSFSFL